MFDKIGVPTIFSEKLFYEIFILCTIYMNYHTVNIYTVILNNNSGFSRQIFCRVLLAQSFIQCNMVSSLYIIISYSLYVSKTKNKSLIVGLCDTKSVESH